MGRFFAPDFGELEITPFYSDNEVYCQEVRFSIPASEWSEFEKSPSFLELKQRIEASKTQDIRIQYREAAREQENDWSLLRSMTLDSRESFWAAVRRWFREKRQFQGKSYSWLEQHPKFPLWFSIVALLLVLVKEFLL